MAAESAARKRAEQDRLARDNEAMLKTISETKGRDAKGLDPAIEAKRAQLARERDRPHGTGHGMARRF